MISLLNMGLPSKGINYLSSVTTLERNNIIQGRVYLFLYLSTTLFYTYRSLSELEAIRVGGDMGEKIRQVTERATLFRITSNAMINVSYPSINHRGTYYTDVDLLADMLLLCSPALEGL